MHIMKLTDLPDEFIKATPIIEKIEQAGFEAYFVGGSVRDIILNQKISLMPTRCLVPAFDGSDQS